MRVGPTRRSLLVAVTTAPLALTPLAGCTRATVDTNASDSVSSSRRDGVVFTTIGKIFRPAVELIEGSSADVLWLDENGAELARGIEPRITFDSPATRNVTMVTTFDQVLTVNLGFKSTDDAGRHSLDGRYDKDPELVSAVGNLTLLTNLSRFLAASGPLAGTVDLTDLTHLEHVECFKAKVEEVTLTGCQSLVRLCLEECNLRSLDLNPVAASLRDLRAAGQQSGKLEFAPLLQPLAQLYHFCVRDQAVTGHPTAEQLPSCEELWNWNCSQSEALPTPGQAHSVLAASNGYTSADLSGQWVYEGGWGRIDLTDNALTRITVTGCHSLQTILLGGNQLARNEVDSLLVEVASWGTKGFELVVNGTNAAPSAKGTAAALALRARDWKVSTSLG